MKCLVALNVTNLRSSSNLKLTVRRKVVLGTSFPPVLVCFPPPWNVETNTFLRVLGWEGSSQQTGSVLFTSSEATDSPDDWDKKVPPIKAWISLNDDDLPLAGSPMAIGAGHEPRKNDI